MKRIVLLVMASCLCFCGCKQQENSKTLLQRSFYNNTWERFDYLDKDIEITEATSFDLSMKISFTEDYPYDYFDFVFVVFTKDGERYRGKEYMPKLKDEEGHWSSEFIDGCYSFNLPINKELEISDPGTYRFHIEQKMPKTPLVGVKELTLTNN